MTALAEKLEIGADKHRRPAVLAIVGLALVASFTFFGATSAMALQSDVLTLSSQSLNRALSKAVQNGDSEKTWNLLSQGANPNWKKSNPMKDPLLLIAISLGDVSSAQALIHYGADVEAKDSRGTPILVAAASLMPLGREDFRILRGIQVLLRDGKADANSRDRAYIGDGRSALHMAAANGSLHLVRMLLKYGANPNASNRIGETPIYFASHRGHLPIVKELMNYNADPNRKTKKMAQTPIMAAAESGHANVVRYLVSKRVRLHDRDTFGKTPLEIAKDAGARRTPASIRSGSQTFNRYQKTVRILEQAMVASHSVGMR